MDDGAGFMMLTNWGGERLWLGSAEDSLTEKWGEGAVIDVSDRAREIWEVVRGKELVCSGELDMLGVFLVWIS